MNYKNQEEEIAVEELVSIDSYKLIVYNDGVNTFDWVIQSLIEVCGHEETQAQQCTLLIHYKGKAIVKTGIREKLKPMYYALTDRGINSKIEN